MQSPGESTSSQTISTGVFGNTQGYFSLKANALDRNRHECAPHCQCVCHAKRQLRTPQYLHKVLETLFTGYSG